MIPKENARFSKNWLMDEIDRMDAERGTYVRSRFYVEEVTPSRDYWQGDGHGGREVATSRRHSVQVSDFFDDREQAENFMDGFFPDEGKVLEIVEQKLYRKTMENWY